MLRVMQGNLERQDPSSLSLDFHGIVLPLSVLKSGRTSIRWIPRSSSIHPFIRIRNNTQDLSKTETIPRHMLNRLPDQSLSQTDWTENGFH